MSKPHPPYYYEKRSDTYHWELSCLLNYWPITGWRRTDKLPKKRKPCNECKQTVTCEAGSLPKVGKPAFDDQFH